MRANFGSETHHKRCRSYSTLDRHGLGCSPKSAETISAQRRMEGSIRLNPKSSRKMRKPDRLFNMERARLLGIRLKTELALAVMIRSAFMIFLS